jgi:hypothetical protein
VQNAPDGSFAGSRLAGTQNRNGRLRPFHFALRGSSVVERLMPSIPGITVSASTTAPTSTATVFEMHVEPSRAMLQHQTILRSPPNQ